MWERVWIAFTRVVFGWGTIKQLQGSLLYGAIVNRIKIFKENNLLGPPSSVKNVVGSKFSASTLQGRPPGKDLREAPFPFGMMIPTG